MKSSRTTTHANKPAKPAPNSGANSPACNTRLEAGAQAQSLGGVPPAGAAPQGGPMPGAPQGDQAPAPEVQAYIALLDGNTIEEIHATLIQTHTPDVATKAIKLARAKFRAYGKADQDEIKGWCLAASRDLARKMISVGDFASALKAVKQIYDIAHKIQTTTAPDEDLVI